MKKKKWNDFVTGMLPADNMAVAKLELKVERHLKLVKTEREYNILYEIQQLIERVKRDEVKIKQLEDMKGITRNPKKTGHEDG